MDPLKPLTFAVQGREYTLGPSSLATLREFWETSQTLGAELSGVFDVDEDGVLTPSTTIAQATAAAGYATEGYTVSGGAGNDDVPYTFHTHPVEADAASRAVVNLPNLPSSEDLIGVVGDAALNTGALSNPTGASVFDVLVAPIGCFVYAAGPGILDTWLDCEPDFADPDVAREYIDHFVASSRVSRRSKAALRKQLAALDPSALAAHCSAHFDESNVYFAPVENAFLSPQFDALIGSWAHLNRGDGLFATVMIPRYAAMGESPLLDMILPPGQDLNNADNYVQAVVDPAFLALDLAALDPSINAFVAYLIDLGFEAAFIGWHHLLDH